MIVASLLGLFCLAGAGGALAFSVDVLVVSRDPVPGLSYIDKTSTFQQVFNPTYVEPTENTKRESGLLIRTQNCVSDVGGVCTWCGGAQDKASILTFSRVNSDQTLEPVDDSSIVFGPSDSTDSWGTEDPRMKYNPHDGLYYMFYTAYNGSAIFLNLATAVNPTSANGGWKKLGPVFPSQPGSKSAALLIRDKPPHYLLWGDHDIRITKSDDPSVWADIGEVLISPREDHFDSKLVESGPPPMRLSNGDYIFFYNSANIGWPDAAGSAYHVGYLLLDGNDPTIIKARSEVPVMGPEYAWEQGISGL